MLNAAYVEKEGKAVKLGISTTDLPLSTPASAPLEALPRVRLSSLPPEKQLAGTAPGWRPQGPLFPPQQPGFSLLGQEPVAPGRGTCRTGGEAGLRTPVPTGDFASGNGKHEILLRCFRLWSLSDSCEGGENFPILRVTLCY